MIFKILQSLASHFSLLLIFYYNPSEKRVHASAIVWNIPTPFLSIQSLLNKMLVYRLLSVVFLLEPVVFAGDKCDLDGLCYAKCHKGVYDLHTPTYCDDASGTLIRDGCDQYCCKYGVLSGVTETFLDLCETNGGAVLPCC